MQDVSYTISGSLQDTLDSIDILRTKLLSIPIAPKTEIALGWESFVDTIYTTCHLANMRISTAEIERALTSPRRSKTPTGTIVIALSNGYRWIGHHWRANNAIPQAGDIEVLATIALPQPYRTRETFALRERQISQFFRFVNSLKDHPVVTAALVHAYFLDSPLGNKDDGKIARLASRMYLARSDYTLRGMATAESIWGADPKAYAFALSESKRLGQQTPWLEYVAKTVRDSYLVLQTKLNNAAHGLLVTSQYTYAHLSPRQRDILDLSASPRVKLTNLTVQHAFHISPITASRDLTKLAALGLLFMHGKGRSIYYTRT